MYWGKPDASITFCEEKYVVSDYIAEYYNTLSAISYVIIGLFFYFTKLKKIGISLMFLGLGTCMLHCTLRYYGQWFDEIMMLVLCFNIIRELRNRSYKKTSYVILVLLIIGYFLVHHIFSYF